MVKRSEFGILGVALRQGQQACSVGSELLGLSSRVRRAASSLQLQSNEAVVASHGPAKTATLTLLRILLDDLVEVGAEQLVHVAVRDRPVDVPA